MPMNRDCVAWEGYAEGVDMAREMSAFPEMDEIERNLDELARDILADPRRIDAMRRDCPELLEQVEARAPTLQTPQPANPFADPTGLARRLRELGEDQFFAVEEVVAGERARRAASSAQ
jgi:hypothetical protein